MIAYKFLGPGATGPFTAFAWPRPDGGPGAWIEAPIDPCRSGIHACRRDDLPLWLGRELYLEQMRATIEASGRIAEPDIPAEARDRLLAAFRGWRAP